MLIKRQNVNIILINFQQFLITINTEHSSCALNLFDMTVWKMMDEIMKICYQYLVVKIRQNFFVYNRSRFFLCLI